MYLLHGILYPARFSAHKLGPYAFRGLSILDECRQPLFAEGMSHLLSKQQQRSLEPRLLRQLLQASTLARAAGMPVSLPEPLEKSAAKWWRTTANRVPSLSHDGVSRTLKNLGVKHKILVFLMEGLPTVDIALEAGTDQQKVAIQVNLTVRDSSLESAVFITLEVSELTGTSICACVCPCVQLCVSACIFATGGWPT